MHDLLVLEQRTLWGTEGSEKLLQQSALVAGAAVEPLARDVRGAFEAAWAQGRD